MANNYKVKMVDLQNKYKFKIFCSSQMYDDTDLKREVEAIYKAFPKASATGTSATLNGTAAALMNIDLKGNGGKNLFDGELYNGQIGSNGGYTSATNRITNISGIGVSSTTELPAGTYTLSIEGLDNCSLLTKNAGGTILENFANSWNNLPFTFTLTQAGYLYFTGRKSNSADITPSDYNAQVEKGSTATDYEPYGASVTGDNTIDICGKNLYNSSFRTDAGYITAINCTATENDGVFTLTATGSDMYIWNVKTTSGTAYDKTSGPLIPFEDNSCSIYITNNLFKKNFITFYDENKNSLGFKQFLLDKFTFTKGDSSVPVNAKYFSMRIGNGSATSGTSYSFSVEIEKGNTIPTTHEPYIGKSYPINLGSTKLKTDDSIQGSKNNWNIVRADGTIEAITDATLITQLNNLRYNAESYEGQTNISQTNNDLPFIITASAIKDLSNL